MSELLLEVRDLTVSFDGFKDIDGLNVSVPPRSVRVLIGPNGAGKSTLLDTIIGRVRPAKGKVIFKGHEITHVPEYEIVQRGICRKFQAPGILDSLTVFENLVLAARHSRPWWSLFRTGVERETSDRVEEILDLIQLREKRGVPARELAHGQKQWLEIGMVVASDADLLLLDEPAAGMSHGEVEQTAELIRNLSNRHSLIVIDHDMTFVAQLEAPVSVLHMGRMLKEGTLEEVRGDPQVVAVYLGRVEEDAVANA